MRKAMEDKSVCYYCGTIYDKELGKCPLCGSTVRSSQDEAERPQPRRRLTEKERKERRRKTHGGKFRKKSSKVSARPIMIAALVFLILAVLALGWFIMDMLGWLPGMEDNVDRETPAISEPDTSCTDLTLNSNTISLTAAGETAQLEVRVNLYCGETVYVNSMDEAVASVVKDQVQTVQTESYKTVTFPVTAVAEGETEIRITCGAREAVCKVVCEFTEPVDSTGDQTPDSSDSDPTDPPPSSEGVDEDYLPEVNHEGDITFTARGEKLTLRVTNLPAGETAAWKTDDESIVKVNAYGEVTAIGGGKTKIYVTVAGKTTEILVRCNFGDFIDKGAHLESGRSDVTVVVGESFKLYLFDSDGDRIEDVTYEISDESVCKVEDGVVTAIGYGTSEVTIVYYDMEFTCIVRVR